MALGRDSDLFAAGVDIHGVHDRASGRTSSYLLPNQYDASPDRRYPVVYYLHGAGGSESSSREFAWAVKQGIADGAIDEVIYIFPNGGHYGGYRDWDDGSVMAETWIIKELIPRIDSTYRTIASRNGRALCWRTDRQSFGRLQRPTARCPRFRVQPPFRSPDRLPVLRVLAFWLPTKDARSLRSGAVPA